MNSLFIDLMDTTAFNYVRGGLLIEAAEQGPCLLSDGVARNDERLIDSRATGLKDEAPSLSHGCRSFFLSPPCRIYFLSVLFFLTALSQVAFTILCLILDKTGCLFLPAIWLAQIRANARCSLVCLHYVIRLA